MRIRKNKKLTASMIWSTAASPSSPNPPEELMQTHVCVLNRSPWDAPLSLPPLNYPLADDFLPSPISSHHQQVMEEDDDDIHAINGSSACDDSLPSDDNSRRSIDSMKISSDYDNKSSMSMSILPTPSSAATNNNSKDKDKASSAMGPPRRRGRPKKVVAQPPSLPPPANPNEFYYYSGFGPRWGKRRGGDHQKQSAAIDKGKDNAALFSLSSTDDELDYIDDDYEDDDDEDEEVDGSRKRTRKLVKARSLKSLM